MSEPRFADALFIPEANIRAATRGGDALDRGLHVNEVARPLLGLESGEWVGYKSPEWHDGVYGRLVIKAPGTTWKFPASHPRSRQDRHDWSDGPDGIKLGYSKAD